MQRTQDDVFDRQRRIDWWQQETIEAARVLVVGAGAIGNEVLKNLCLLGFRELLVWDFDEIEPSNLSRTVLFRRDDVGLSKARVAAERARELALNPDVRIEYREGDAVWDLGLGTVRSCSIVLGCLDNTEARMAINRACRRGGVPFIDGGIHELNCRVSVFLPFDRGCFECGMNKRDYEEAGLRYSCDKVRRDMVASGRVPTVQVAAAWCAALQVQEAVKVLHGRTDMDARMIMYVGATNLFDVYTQPRRADCPAHVTVPAAEPLGITARATLRELLDDVCKAGRSGAGARLDLRGERSFVIDAECRRCLRTRPIMKPRARIFDADLACASPLCDIYGDDPESAGLASTMATEMNTRAVFGHDVDPPALLDRTLFDLGVPDRHILAVEGAGGEYRYYELAPV